MGTVTGDTPVTAGWGLGDLLREPEKHEAIHFGPWLDRAVCRCGVIAFADHAGGAWRAPDGHELAFGAGGVFTLGAGPPQPVDEPDLSALPTRRGPSSRRARMVAAALDIELPADLSPIEAGLDPMDEPEASGVEA